MNIKARYNCPHNVIGNVFYRKNVSVYLFENITKDYKNPLILQTNDHFVKQLLFVCYNQRLYYCLVKVLGNELWDQAIRTKNRECTLLMKMKNVLLSTAAAASSLFAIGATAHAATVTVKAGDTVSAIAKQNNTTVSAIEKANQLNNVNLIFVGQQLEVNGTANSATTTTQTNTTQSSQTTQSAPVAQTQSQASTSTSNYSNNGSDSDAKAWIANKESGGSYSATNGQYIGKYQLSASYLGGDYSAANQERVADSYVASRYGSWSNAKAHWLANNWY